MSQLPRYESYKDSGVQWLGEIPSHWKVTRLKFMAKIQNGSDYKHVQAEDGYPVIGSGGQFTYATEYLYKGESVLLGRKGTIDRPLYVNCAFWTVDTMYYTEIFNITFPKFLYYCALTVDFWKYSTQTALPSMTQTALSNLMFATPEYAEQKIIADFLDKRLAQVDALIAKQETLLEKLAEQRVALISHAVTKGLNPDVEMKKTGIKWIGDIPKHWRIMGLKKSLASIVDYRGKTPEKVEQGIFLVTARNIKNGFIDYSLSKEYVEEDLYLDIMSRGLPEIGDVLLTTEAPLGEVAQIDKTDIALAQRIIKFRGKKDVIDNTFLKYFMLSRSFQASLYTYSSGSTAIGIKAERLSYLKVAVPPLEEQEIISKFIAKGVHDIDGMVDKVHQTIRVLREYRSTLITRVMTGKIDVRNLKVN